MKKLLFVISIFLFTGAAHSQDMMLRHFDADEVREQLKGNSKWFQTFQKEEIKSYKGYAIYYKHGKLADTFVLSTAEINETEGRFNNYNKKGKEKGFSVYTFKDGNLIGYEVGKNGKPHHRFEYAFDANGNRTSFSSYWHSWKKMQLPVWRDEITYNTARNPVRKISYQRGKLRYDLVYEYDEQGQKQKVTQYNGKGKILDAWVYDCAPEGKSLSQMKKDSSLVCIRHEEDGKGNTIKVVEEIFPGEKTAKMVFKYNAQGETLEHTNYNKKGMIISRRLNVYNEKGKLVSTAGYVRNKLKDLVIMTYDDKNERESRTEYKKDGVTIKQKYLYEENENGDIKTTELNKNNEIVAVYKIIYQHL